MSHKDSANLMRPLLCNIQKARTVEEPIGQLVFIYLHYVNMVWLYNEDAFNVKQWNGHQTLSEETT